MEFLSAIMFFFVLGWLVLSSSSGQSKLSVDFYAQSCPQMEAIVRKAMENKLNEGKTITAPSTLRLFFHDCFVQGCDASVLISSTSENMAERDADINLSLSGDSFDVVNQAKEALEEACPDTVSCADILAVLARDATFMSQGPFWRVKKGRRDSRTSFAFRATAELPSSSASYAELVKRFRSRNLSSIDLVTLSGSHTIGAAHCVEFTDRLQQADSSMDPELRNELLIACPPGVDPNVVVSFDNLSPLIFDNNFFKHLLNNSVLLASDQVLLEGMKKLVTLYAHNQKLFFENFAAAMEKFGEVGVLTGSQGEIRKDCTSIN